VGVLLLFSLPSVANRLWHAVESGTHDTVRDGVTYDAVVLLGGVTDSFGAASTEPSWGDNVERLTVTHRLLATGKARHVIVSGGRFDSALPTEAEYLARQLEAWGIEKDRILLEDKARNTRENATLSKALIDQRGFKDVLIVTSAFHMPRAEGCFRAVDQPVDTLAVDYRMRDASRDKHLAPRSEYLFLSSEAIHEVVGRVVYRLAGYSR
jgi:uncharacterized SAM-binding protein YcdF (DUF218 family)